MSLLRWSLALGVAVLFAADAAPARQSPARPAEAKWLYSYGTAFVVNADGYLITNAHVIQGAQQVYVKFGRRSYRAAIARVWHDSSTDLALLKIDAAGLVPLPLGESVKRGDSIAVFGFPLPDKLGIGLKMTAGKVNGFVAVASRTPQGGRAMPRGWQETPAYDLLLDAVVNHGNSGGPVVNEYGEAIGVATRGVNRQLATSANLAQPILVIKRFLSRNTDSTGSVRWTRGQNQRQLEGAALDRVVSPSVALVETRRPGW